jgi:hypothetical protein
MANSTDLELSLEGKALRLAEVGVGFVLHRSATFIFNCGLRLWRELRYRLFGIRYFVTVIGKSGARLIVATSEERNQPTCIIGQPGSGKTGVAANMAIQDIEQGEAGIYIDPHGHPFETNDRKKGGVVHILERCKNINHVVFLSVNQVDKIIGCNFLFHIGQSEELDEIKDELMSPLFGDALETGYQVANRGKLLIESALYLPNAYIDWLAQIKSKNNKQIQYILKTHQLTITDLASLQHNLKLVDLFILLLGFKGSRYYRPDLVQFWQEVKDKGKLDVGLQGAAGRLEKIVSTTRAQYFFESHGFDLARERKRGKFVLIDISGLDEYTKWVISRLIFVKGVNLQIKGRFQRVLRVYIDEAASLAMPKLVEMISQGRKFFLDLVLIVQYKKQFENSKEITAVREACVNKLYFRSEDGEYNAPVHKIAVLKNREFIYITSKGVIEGVQTLDMPRKRRSVQLKERGENKEEVRRRIMLKKQNIFTYFTNV